jgi:hypothetical protein
MELTNGFINQFKKEQILKWVDLILKNAVVNSEIIMKK